MLGRLAGLVAWAAEVVGAHQVILLAHDAEAGGLRPLAHWGSGQPVESYIPLGQWALGRGGALALHGGELAAIPFSPGPDMAIITAPVLPQGSPPGVLVALVPRTDPEGLATRLTRLRFLAELAAGLLETTALEAALQRQEKELRDLARTTVDAQETERQHISLEMHDSVVQTLTSAFHHLQSLEERIQDNPQAQRLVGRATALVRQAIQECRALMGGLQPAALHPKGLVATLRQEVRQMKSDWQWQISLHAPEEIKLPLWVETNLYRIVREALSNVRKHADTQRVWIRLERQGDRLVLEVKDEGRGFDPQALGAAPERKGLGLVSMRKRAELLRGRCTVDSRPNQGTTVRVEIPASGWDEA